MGAFCSCSEDSGGAVTANQMTPEELAFIAGDRAKSIKYTGVLFELNSAEIKE